MVHRVVFADCRQIKEIPDDSIQLMVTSPYYNARFDYPDYFKDYAEFLGLIEDPSKDCIALRRRDGLHAS